MVPGSTFGVNRSRPRSCPVLCVVADRRVRSGWSHTRTQAVSYRQAERRSGNPLRKRSIRVPAGLRVRSNGSLARYGPRNTWATKPKPTIDLGYPTPLGDIPSFDNVEEEAEWWDTHDTTDFQHLFESVRIEIGGERAKQIASHREESSRGELTEKLALRLHRSDRAALTNHAKRKGIGPPSSRAGGSKSAWRKRPPGKRRRPDRRFPLHSSVKGHSPSRLREYNARSRKRNRR